MMKRNLFGLFGVSMACFMIVGAGCAAEHKDLLYSFDVPLGAEFDYNSVSAQLQTEGFIKDDQYQAIKAKANGALQADDFATTLSSNAATIKDTIATEGYLKSADLAGYATTEQLNGKLNTSELATELAETANANAVKNIISADTTVAKTSDLSGYAALSSGKISADVLPANTVIDADYATVKTNAANALKTLPDNVVTTGTGGKISTDVLPAGTVVDSEYATVKTNAANALKTLPENVVTTGTGGKISADVIPTLTSDKLPANTVIDADYVALKTNAVKTTDTEYGNIKTLAEGALQKNKLSEELQNANVVTLNANNKIDDSQLSSNVVTTSNIASNLPDSVLTTTNIGKTISDNLPSNVVTTSNIASNLPDSVLTTTNIGKTISDNLPSNVVTTSNIASNLPDSVLTTTNIGKTISDNLPSNVVTTDNIANNLPSTVVTTTSLGSCTGAAENMECTGLLRDILNAAKAQTGKTSG